MELSTGDQSDFLQQLFDVIPAVVFVADADVRVRYGNATALDWLRTNQGALFMSRGGEALHCLHAAETPAGCGHAPACRNCVLRSSVEEVMQGGRVRRRQTMMTVDKPAGPTEVQLLVTAAPLQYRGEDLVLVVLEDISELVQLRSFLPICASCKRIRNDADYWESVEAYFERQLGVDFTHSICPECIRRLYPDLRRPAEPSSLP